MRFPVTPRAIALALILCLLALDAAPHVHFPDAGKAPAECSLCVSGSHANAVAPVPLPVLVPLRHLAPVHTVDAFLAFQPRFHQEIRGPPILSAV